MEATDPRPLIAVVNDQPSQLEAMLRALTRRYAADYEVIGSTEGAAMLATLADARQAGRELALVIADQWMPHMRGVEVLVRAHALHPGAKRALLVAWGDRLAAPAILEGCAFDQLDNYLLKPWEPAEVHLYPPVGEFLSEWTREQRPPLELVRIIAEAHDGRAFELDDLLLRNGVPHGVHLVSSPEGRALLQQTGMLGAPLPVVVLPHGRAFANPSNAMLADALEATSVEARDCDLAIVGGGPAGLAAAVYGASEGLAVIVVEREAMGGQAGTSTLIRNYLGFPRGISGAELAQRAYQQAWLFGTKFVFAREAVALHAAGDRRIVTLDDGTEIDARAVLVAGGARYRRLPAPTLEPFVGRGVFYTTVTDPRILRGHEAFVVGGGNAAGQAVVKIAKHAAKVHLVVRGDQLSQSMSHYLVQEIARLDQVVVHFATEVVGGSGSHRLEALTLCARRSGALTTVPAQMLFVMIGVDPHTDWLAATVARDHHGFLLTGPDVPTQRQARSPLRFETSLPGVFAAGDVRAGSAKRVASAVGEGAGAVGHVHEYLRVPVSLPEPSPRASRDERPVEGAPAPGF